MSWRKTVLPFAVLMTLASSALAVAPILKLQQGPAGAGNCDVTFRIAVDPQGNTIDVSQFTLRYKASQLTFVNATVGADAPVGSTLEWNTDNGAAFPVCGAPACAACGTDFDRHVIVNMAPPAGQSYTGTGVDRVIVQLNFTAAAGASTVKMEWDQSSPPGLKPTYVHTATGDLFGTSLAFTPNAVPPTCPGFTFTVPNPPVGGTVWYYSPTPLPNTNFVPNTQVCLNPPSMPNACGTSAASDGKYNITSAVPGNGIVATPTKSTEPTDPNALGGGDINRLIQALAALVTLTPDQQIAADVDLSGVPPNAGDLQKLRRYIVFDFAQCPNCATWRFNCDPLGGNTQSPCTINVATCATTTLNLKGILRGDVDSSWPSRAKPSAPTMGTVAFAAPRWTGDDLTLSVVSRDDRVGLSSTVFTLRYDAEALEYVSAEPGTATERFELTVNPAAPGTVHGLLTGGLEPDAAPGEILRVRFRARNGNAARVSFERLFLNDQAATSLPEVEVERGSETATAPRRFTMKAAPNPFNPTTQIDYSIPSVAGTVPVTLQVVDLSGRLVRDLVRAEQGTGSYHTIWDGRDASGEGLASGVYMIHLRAGDWRSSQKAVLLK